MKNPKDIVRKGYDRVSYAYCEDEPDRQGERFNKYKAWVDELTQNLREGSRILDLGCGCGVPVARLLAERFRVTGVDISPVQIERARKLVPRASFVCRDMCDLDFDRGAFEAIICLYAIIHIPLAEQQDLLDSMWQWLKPGGLLLLVSGHNAWTGAEKDWLGVEGGDMYWSHAGRDTYIEWLQKAGFDVIWDRFVPEAESGHTLIFSRKKAG